MPSLTIKLPAKLNRKLRIAAHKRKENLSVLTRRALERELAAPVPDFATLAKPYIGMFSGPRDLSTREGYGR
jgi:predicted transcriptional regulator